MPSDESTEYAFTQNLVGYYKFAAGGTSKNTHTSHSNN